jgi:hypothetical protein
MESYTYARCAECASDLIVGVPLDESLEAGYKHRDNVGHGAQVRAMRDDSLLKWVPGNPMLPLGDGPLGGL